MDFGCILEGLLRGFFVFIFASSSEACKWIIVFFQLFLLLKSHSGFAVKYKKTENFVCFEACGSDLGQACILVFIFNNFWVHFWGSRAHF